MSLFAATVRGSQDQHVVNGPLQGRMAFLLNSAQNLLPQQVSEVIKIKDLLVGVYCIIKTALAYKDQSIPSIL